MKKVKIDWSIETIYNVPDDEFAVGLKMSNGDIELLKEDIARRAREQFYEEFVRGESVDEPQIFIAVEITEG